MIDRIQIERLEQIKDNLEAEVAKLAADIAILKLQVQISESVFKQ